MKLVPISSDPDLGKRYEIYTNADKKLGEVRAVWVSDDTVKITDAYLYRRPFEAKNGLGVANARSIVRQFLADNPGVKQVIGERVSGARHVTPVRRGQGTNIAVRIP